jgi:hypothetical protein
VSKRMPSIVVERRGLMRHSCLAAGAHSMTATVGDKPSLVPIHDISTAGIGVVLDHRLDPGTLVTIELLNRTWNFWHLKLLRVVHATPQADDRWLVGSVFLRKFSDDEFQALLG